MLKDPRKILYADTIFYNDSLQKIEAKQNVHFSEIEKKLEYNLIISSRMNLPMKLLFRTV
jgi:hypothetical protein